MKIQRFFFAKICPSGTAYMWYDSQGYDEILVTFVTLKSHILGYFIPSAYAKKARQALVA